MATLRKGAPAKNMFGSIQNCDAVIEYRPCPKRATFTVIPDHIPGVNFTLTYWCDSHHLQHMDDAEKLTRIEEGYEKATRDWPVITVPERQY